MPPSVPALSAASWPSTALRTSRSVGYFNESNVLDLEFTFAIWGRKIEAELPSETLGMSEHTDTAILIPLTTDLHLPTPKVLKI